MNDLELFLEKIDEFWEPDSNQIAEFLRKLQGIDFSSPKNYLLLNKVFTVFSHCTFFSKDHVQISELVNKIDE